MRKLKITELNRISAEDCTKYLRHRYVSIPDECVCVCHRDYHQ